MAKHIYHTFKRRLPDADKTDPPWTIKARCLNGISPVTMRFTRAHIMEAIKRNGQGDAQNCAGAVCLIKHKGLFDHPVSTLVDWWRSRVYIAEPPNPRTGKINCRVYAHFDDVEELFDTVPGLKKLLKRMEDKEFIEITLYPIKKGKHPVTGKKSRPSGPSGTSGEHRQPRRIGDELRFFNYTQSRQQHAV